MIKFFRNIRRRLLQEKRISRYLLYAIGEIILVVIGILIALQINNWNEDRKEKAKATAYTSKIINDIIQDTININENTAYVKTAKNQINQYFAFFNKGAASIDKLIDSSRNVNSGYLRYIPVNQTFLDMQASGNSNLLTERQREAIINLISSQEQLTIIIEKIISSSLNQRNEMKKYLSYPNDFFEKINLRIDQNRKVQYLLHQHSDFDLQMELYDFVEIGGNRIKQQSKEAIKILQNSKE